MKFHVLALFLFLSMPILAEGHSNSSGPCQTSKPKCGPNETLEHETRRVTRRHNLGGGEFETTEDDITCYECVYHKPPTPPPPPRTCVPAAEPQCAPVDPPAVASPRCSRPCPTDPSVCEVWSSSCDVTVPTVK